MSDEYPLIPPPSRVRMSFFAHGVDVTLRSGERRPAEPERALGTSVVVESFGTTIETRVGTRFDFGLDERSAEGALGI
jgi:hypothetical protein